MNDTHTCAIRQYSEDDLKARFGDETGVWLYDICRGICRAEVKERTEVGSMQTYTCPCHGIHLKFSVC